MTYMRRLYNKWVPFSFDTFLVQEADKCVKYCECFRGEQATELHSTLAGISSRELRRLLSSGMQTPPPKDGTG